MTGRTSWWPCDAAEHAREHTVELGQEFGPAGPLALRVLKDVAGQQRADGALRHGFRSLARDLYDVDPKGAREIVEYAASIGALDDLEIDEDGRRFTCRVSGWQADRQRGLAALRQAAKRGRDRDPDGEDPDPEGNEHVTVESDSVTPERDVSRLHNTRGEVPSPLTPPSVEPARLDDARERLRAEQVSELFAYWQQQCGHPHAKLTADRRKKVQARLREGYTVEQVRCGIDGAAAAAFVNDQGKRFDDLELICRTGSKLEDFIDRASSTEKPIGEFLGGFKGRAS